MNAFLWCILNSCFPAPMFRIVNYKKFSFCDLLLSSLCIVLICSGHLKYLKILKLVVLYRILCDWYQLASTGLHLLPKLLLINIQIHTIRNVLKREKKLLHSSFSNWISSKTNLLYWFYISIICLLFTYIYCNQPIVFFEKWIVC